MRTKQLFLILALLCTMVQGASALNGSGSSGDPYLIASPADWETFATSPDAYSDTFFKLTADITVTTMRTKTFKGTFDGGGNTLTFNYTTTGDNAAPFAYITGATIKNLRVAGTITTSKKFAAGIVAISNGGAITNCRSSVTINSSVDGDGTHGGLVADSYQGTLDINNCLFDGKLLGTTTTSCGGIVGWHNSNSTLNISNSLFAPAEVTVQGGAIFARKSATALTNCYYISNWAAATVQGTNANSMTAEALVAALNNGTKNWCVHRGNAIPVMVNLVISTKAQWDTFAANVGNYDSKYVQLGANIGTTKTPVTAMKSGEFKGVFDGNGKTMTVNFSADTGNEGAFRYLNDGTIMNLTITGTVTAGGNYASGLVARTSGGDCLIDNCVVNTNVAGSGYAGGIVAHGDNATKLTITNCIYGGEISKVSSYSGGILGWYNNNGTMDLVINNCLCKGIYTGTADFHPIGLKRATNCSFKSISCTNCYYTTNPHKPGGRNFTDGTKVCELSLGDNISATGSSCIFDGKTYHLGTVSLSYTPSKPTLFYMIDGNGIIGNSFTISKDNQAFNAGAVTITAGDTSITYHYGGTNNTILYIDVNNGNSNMVTHPWTSEANYSSITSVVIGNGVTSICGNAFKQCPNLTSASIASTVTSIDNQAFSECGKLETVTCLASTPPTGGLNMFNGNASGRKIYVPAGSVSNYKSAAYWSSYASDIIGIQSLTLNENTSNSTAIQNANGQMSEVTLSGRTLYKDGAWNTICLPFDVTIAGSPLAGATVMELDTEGIYEGDKQTGLVGTTLNLYFKEATSITAGKPYIIKWASAANITDPVFTGVTIDNTNRDVSFAGGSFKGTYDYNRWNAENKSILFVGTGNNLYWPQSGASLGACRAYFQLTDPNATAREINLNFGENNGDATGLNDNVKMINDNEADAWYTLDGRKLDGKPTTKGLYIHGGRKVVIK